MVNFPCRAKATPAPPVNLLDSHALRLLTLALGPVAFSSTPGSLGLFPLRGGWPRGERSFNSPPCSPRLTRYGSRKDLRRSTGCGPGTGELVERRKDARLPCLAVQFAAVACGPGSTLPCPYSLAPLRVASMRARGIGGGVHAPAQKSGKDEKPRGRPVATCQVTGFPTPSRHLSSGETPQTAAPGAAAGATILVARC